MEHLTYPKTSTRGSYLDAGLHNILFQSISWPGPFTVLKNAVVWAKILPKFQVINLHFESVFIFIYSFMIKWVPYLYNVKRHFTSSA
jgi:hypothetical protein